MWWRKRKRRRSSSGTITRSPKDALQYKLKNTVANLGRRCKVDSKTVRDYASPILCAVQSQPGSVTCIYCYTVLTLDTISFDHLLPLSRGGENWVPNLGLCCTTCNKTKGSLTEEEYCSLLELMIGWPQEARDNVCRRLRLGGSFFGRFKRRK